MSSPGLGVSQAHNLFLLATHAKTETAKTVSDKSLEHIEEWVQAYTRDPDGAFGLHAMCVWSLTPTEHHGEMLVGMKSLLTEPDILESERAAQFEFFVSERVHALGLCKASRDLLCMHVQRMIQHRPYVPGDDI